MSKKICLAVYVFKKFWFWENRPYVAYVRPPVHESRGEILHFKHLRVSAVNCMAAQTFREKKYNNNKADSFFRLNFNVNIDVKWITENELEREIKKRKKKQRRPISLEEKRDNFIAAVRKWEHQSFIKRVTRKCLDVSRCSRVKQRRRNVPKKLAAHHVFVAVSA